jgi:signal transduction histidine kinase
MPQHTILFVDDETNILNALRRAFRKEDYRMLSASSAMEAYEILEREPVSVVVSDQRMPSVSGAEFLGRIKEKYPDIIRILLTGFRDYETVEQAINQAECYRFIPKPWNDHDLRMTLRSAVEKHDLIAENRRLQQLTEAQNRELTELNAKLEQKVAERTRQLIQSEKMAAIGLLAGGVAHEINNPLAGILALTQIRLKETPQDSQLAADLKKIEQLAYRCETIVQEILDFSRDAEREGKEPVDLNKMIEKSLHFVTLQSKECRVEIKKDLAPDLPPVRGNHNQLQQVFLNLMTNACHAMADGGRISLSTRYARDRGHAELQVADTGCGIPPEEMPRVFDPFFTTKRRGRGTGLGLSISYKIIEDHQGTIRVESRPGEGSVFTVSLPVSQ